ncbi:hypothetical protein ACFL1X_11125 [Candidatus Hydrogenedentota bacterium]
MKKNAILAASMLVCVTMITCGCIAGKRPSTQLERTPFGVVGINNFLLQDIPLTVEKLESLNVQWVRVTTSYFIFNKEKRERLAPIYINLVNELDKAGINVLGQLSGNRHNADWTKPEEMAQFKEYVEYLLVTFPPITHWEIWNEPDSSHFFGQDPNPDYYMAIVKTAYETIKDKNKNHKVLVGAFTQNGLANHTKMPRGHRLPRMLEECYERGLKDFSDIISFHPYTNIKHPRHGLPYLRAKLGESMALMAKHGDAEKPIWLTEVGVPLGPTIAAKDKKVDTAPEDVAEWVGIYYEETLRYRQIEKLFWMCLRDWPNPKQPESTKFGLFETDWTPRPAATKFTELAARYGKTPYWIENVEPIDMAPVEFYSGKK